MKLDYTKSRIETARKLVRQFAPELTDIELHVLDISLKEIAKSAVADYMKCMLNTSYEIDAEINEIQP